MSVSKDWARRAGAGCAPPPFPCAAPRRPLMIVPAQMQRPVHHQMRQMVRRRPPGRRRLAPHRPQRQHDFACRPPRAAARTSAHWSACCGRGGVRSAASPRASDASTTVPRPRPAPRAATPRSGARTRRRHNGSPRKLKARPGALPPARFARTDGATVASPAGAVAPAPFLSPRPGHLPGAGGKSLRPATSVRRHRSPGRHERVCPAPPPPADHRRPRSAPPADGAPRRACRTA